jgi:polar amino acid transport system permease protein
MSTPPRFAKALEETSLASIIGRLRAHARGAETIERTRRSFEIYGVAAAIYFALCFPLTRLAARLGRP